MTFEEYLISKGYSKTTPKGEPSTAYNYQVRVKAILTNEHAGSKVRDVDYIRGLIEIYDRGGTKEAIGNQSKRSNINALKQYLNYLQDSCDR